MTGRQAEAVILRDDDPRCTELERTGYRVVARSWGARLVLAPEADLAPLRGRVAHAEAAGYVVDELDTGWAEPLLALEQANHDDYPVTPATPAKAWTLAEIESLWPDGWRVFGALQDGALVGATLIRQQGDYAETESTSVLADHRGHGIGIALKAASVLALAAAGVRTFGTGGAAVNAASIAMNEAAGYRITETWLSYAPPARS